MIKDFVAIDFETANFERHSICQVGLVVVEDNKIVDEFSSFVFPPGGKIIPKFTEIHGITNDDIRHADVFPDIFSNELLKRISNKQLIAHNIAFDKDVMLKTMYFYEMHKEISNMDWNWKCTLKSFRSLNYFPCGLKPLSERFDIKLNHHESLSDAKTCAKLFMIYNELTNL